MKMPKLENAADNNEAKRYVRALTHWIGPGFHPDTDMNEYVTCSDGARCFDSATAQTLNHEIDLARKQLNQGAVDIFSVALSVQRRLLLSAMRH